MLLPAAVHVVLEKNLSLMGDDLLDERVQIKPSVGNIQYLRQHQMFHAHVSHNMYKVDLAMVQVFFYPSPSGVVHQ